MNLIIVLCLLLSLARAQDTVAPQSEHEPETYALLVGASNFQNITGLGRPEAKALCAKSALALYETLGTQRVAFACNPEQATRPNILANAAQIGQQAQEGDTILMLYIGLGIGGDFGDPMLLTQDSSGTTEQVGETSVRLDELTSALGLNGAQLVFFLDATVAQTAQLLDNDGLYSAATIGPTAADVSGQHLALSYANSAQSQPTNPTLFGELIAKGLEGGADLNQSGSISLAELNRYMVQELTASTGQPPGVRGTWNEAVAPIIRLPQPVVNVPPPKARPTWQYNLPSKVRRATFIAGGSALLLSGGTFAGARAFHGQLVDQAYDDEDGYNRLVLGRNTLLITSQVALSLGLAGMGSASFTLTRDADRNLTFGISLPW